MERRRYERVQFGRGYTARIMAIDGTWQRECRIGDVSDTGAKLKVRGSLDTIDTKEFFLVLSPTGKAFRRCERIWISGSEFGVRFLKDSPADVRPPAAKPARRRRPHQASQLG